MFNFLKKYWLIFLLAGVAILLFLIKTFFVTKPTAPPVLEKLPVPKFSQEPITNQILGYQLNFSLPTTFPASLSVYKIFSFKTQTFPEIKPDLGGETLVSSDSAAIKLAKVFLKEKGIGEEFTNISQVTYRKVDKMETFPASSSAEADIFIVNFWPEVDEITVVSNQPLAPLTSVWVGKNGEIQKAVATTFSLEKTKSYPLRAPNIAQQDILEQKGTLVWLEEEETYGFSPPKTVGNVTIERISLAYFLPQPSFSFLEPIFIFEGKATLSNGKIVGAAVYLPAIEEKYLTP